ncbi:hypothetical protein [Vreelandella sp. H-I2]
MTQYTHTITIAVPAAHIADANQLALVLGETAADDQTFGALNYQDEAGNRYSVCSTVAKPIFTENAGKPLVAPEFAPAADLAAATRAQALLSINDQPAAHDRIAARVGTRHETAQQHIAALGLTPLPSEEEV